MTAARIRFPLAPILLLVAATAPAQQPSPPPRLPVFPGAVEQVVVDVVVVDEHGRPVTGLAASDFVLSEDGVPRDIVSFEAVAAEGAGAPPGTTQNRLPRALGVVFDDVHLTTAAGERVQETLAEVLKTVLRDSDEVALLRTSSGQAWAGRVGEDRSSLLAALATLRGLRQRVPPCEMTDEEAMQIHVDNDVAIRKLVFERLVKCQALIAPPAPLERGGPPPAPPPMKAGEGQIDTWAAEQHQRGRERMRATYRTLETLLRALGPLRGRKTVILASEGFVRDRGLDEAKGVIAAASDANAAVYFLDARALTPRTLTASAEAPAGASPDELGRLHQDRFRGGEAAEVLALDTGGAVLAGDLTASLRRLSDESRSYYLLGYAPGDPARDGRFRAIRVDLKRAGLVARARRGYYALPRTGPPPANVAAAAAPAAPSPAAAPASGGDDAREADALGRAAAALAGGEPQEPQARAAIQAAGLLRDAARRRALERRLLLGFAHRFLEARQWPVALALAEQAASRLDGDADALLALGIVQETTGSVVDSGHKPLPDDSLTTAGLDEMVSRNPVTGFAAGVPGGPAGRAPDFRARLTRTGPLTAEARLRRAADAYRRALKARPDLLDARLRLGRALALLGESKAAGQELQAVAAAGAGDATYLAHLFLGDLAEQQRDASSAVTEYRAALSARPGSRVARLALARALHAAGDRAGSHAAMEELLLQPAPDAGADPWWQYRLQPLGRWADAIAAGTP